MTGLHWGIVGVLVGALSLAGCGDDTTATATTTATGTGGASTTTSTTTTSSGGGQGGQGGAGGGNQGGGGQGAGSVCGDGVVEGMEQCEPPATDVCTANCQIPASCDGVPVAVLGNNVGDTTNGTNTGDGSCQLGDGYDVVFQFTPAQDGTLTLTLTSDVDMGIHVRTNCGDAMSEIGCIDDKPAEVGGVETLTVPVTQGATVWIFADGYLERIGGPFTLNVAQP